MPSSPRRAAALAALTLALATTAIGSVLPATASPISPRVDQQPAAFKQGTVSVANQAAWPATLVTGGGGGTTYSSLTDEGTAIEAYGVRKDANRTSIPDDVIARWTSSQDYPGTGDLASASQAAVGLMTSADSPSVAYLSGRELSVTAPENQGFTPLTSLGGTPVASVEVPGSEAVVDLAIFDADTSHPGVVVVATTHQLYAWKLGVGNASLDSIDVTLDGKTSLPFGGTFLAFEHRSVVDNFVADTPPPWSTAMVAVRSSDGKQVAADRVEAGYADAGPSGPRLTLTTSNRNSYHDGYTATSSTDTFTGADIAYDVTTGHEYGGAPSIAWLFTARTPNATTTVFDQESPSFNGPEIVRGTKVCGTGGRPGLDVEVLGSSTGWVCSNVGSDAGSTVLDRWSGSTATASYARTSVPGVTKFVRPQPQIQPPCAYLVASNVGRGTQQVHCFNSRADSVSVTNVDLAPSAINTYLSARSTDLLRPYTAYLVGESPDARATDLGTTSTPPTFAVRVGSANSFLPTIALPLPATPTTITVTLADRTNPESITSNPIPVAFLEAPPTVAGIDQSANPSEFATTSSTGTGSGTSSSVSFGASLAVELEDPTGAYGVGLEQAMKSSVETGTSTTFDDTRTTAYTGDAGENYVVYRALTIDRYDGTVTSSSTGLALGTPTQVDVPTGAQESLASEARMRERFPDEFGHDGTMGKVLDAAFPQTPGDPGSYPSFGAHGAALDDYCDGSLSSTGDRQLHLPDGLLPAKNPFTTPPPVTPPQPDVRLGDSHTVDAGTGGTLSDTFALSQSTTRTRVETIDTESTVSAKAGYFAGSLSTGASWSKTWEETLSKGVSFTSGVSNIRNAGALFDKERYSWRPFVCQKTFDTDAGPVTAWVQAFTVDGYQGSGGFEPLGDITLLTPADGGQVTTSTPELTFREDGTVKRYRVTIEDVATGATQTADVTYATPRASNDRDPQVTVRPTTALQRDTQYRWHVTATDFLGHTTTSGDATFRTAAHGIGTATPRVRAGTKVTLTYQPRDGAPAASTYSWDFGDGTAPLVRTQGTPVKHTYPTAGRYTVQLTVTNGDGTTETSSADVDVRPVLVDDRYALKQGKRLTVTAAKGVQANDLGGGKVSVTTGPKHGKATLRPDGALTYTPDARWCGTDRLTYRITDASDRPSTETATVVLAVACTAKVRTSPDRFTFTAAPGSTVRSRSRSVLDNDRDARGSHVRAKLVSKPRVGTVHLKSDGTFTFEVPRRGKTSTVTFTYALVTADRRTSAPTKVSLVLRRR